MVAELRCRGSKQQNKIILRWYSRMRFSESAGGRNDAVLEPLPVYGSSWRYAIMVDVERILLESLHQIVAV